MGTHLSSCERCVTLPLIKGKLKPREVSGSPQVPTHSGKLDLGHGVQIIVLTWQTPERVLRTPKDPRVHFKNC